MINLIENLIILLQNLYLISKQKLPRMMLQTSQNLPFLMILSIGNLIMMMIRKYDTANYPPLLTRIIWTLHPSFDTAPVRKIAELMITLFYPTRLINLILIIVFRNFLVWHHHRSIPNINLSMTTLLPNLLQHHPSQQLLVTNPWLLMM